MRPRSKPRTRRVREALELKRFDEPSPAVIFLDGQVHVSSNHSPTRSAFQLLEWTVDPAVGTLSRGSEVIRLQPRVMATLLVLAERPGRMVSKEELLTAAWGGAAIEEGAMSQSVHALRKALGDEAKKPRYVETIPRRGYRLLAPVQQPGLDPPAAPPKQPDLPVPLARRWPLLGLPATLVPLFGLLFFSPWSGRGEPRLAEVELGVVEFVREQLLSSGVPAASAIQERQAEGGGRVLEFDLRDDLDDRYSVTFAAGSTAAAQGLLLTVSQDHEPPGRRLLEVTLDAPDRISPAEIVSSVLAAIGMPEPAPSTDCLAAPVSDNFLAGLALLKYPNLGAHLEYDTGVMKEALRRLQWAARDDPRSPCVLAAYSQASSYHYFNSGATNAAARAGKALESARALAPEAREVLLAAAFYTYRVEKDLERALAAFERIPNPDFEVDAARGYVLRRLGRLQESIEAMTRAFEAEPSNSTLATTIAKTEGARRRFLEADHWFGKALEIDADQPQVAGDRAMNRFAWRACTTEGGRVHRPCSMAESRSLLEQARQTVSNPGHLSFFVFLLDLYEATEKPAGSEREAGYRRALETLAGTPVEARNAQDSYSTFWREAHLRRLLGDEGLALELARQFEDQLQEAVEDEPKHPFHHAYLGLSFAFRGDSTNAFARGEWAVEMDGYDRFNGPRMRELLAVNHMLLGQHERALSLLEELRSTSYQYPITPAHLLLEPIWQPLAGHRRFERLLATTP